jgi:3-methyladenine DNA glycosylase/8-oxoguanine DNA glycosylase
VPLEATIVPHPPYSLALSARMKSDATRVFRDGVLTLAFQVDDHPLLARVRQRPDGSLAARIDGVAGPDALEHLRFVLAADDHHEPFLRRFEHDPLIGEATRRLRGLRPLRTATVTHALLKAVCGQLIQARAARTLEARLLRRRGIRHGDLRLPPTRETFGLLAPAQLARDGLVARKATALVRLSREWDVERLRRVGTGPAAARIERERGLGPWSAGMICLHGLGRYERGLVGDLGLLKLCSALRGRRADVDDTRELLEPYAEWAGLASVYLLAGGGVSDGRPFRRRRPPTAAEATPSRARSHTGRPVNGRSSRGAAGAIAGGAESWTAGARSSPPVVPPPPASASGS